MTISTNKVSNNHYVPPVPIPPIPAKPEPSVKESEVKMPASSGSVGTMINTTA